MTSKVRVLLRWGDAYHTDDTGWHGCLQMTVQLKVLRKSSASDNARYSLGSAAFRGRSEASMARPQPGSALVTTSSGSTDDGVPFGFCSLRATRRKVRPAFECNTSLRGLRCLTLIARLNGRGIALCPGNPPFEAMSTASISWRRHYTPQKMIRNRARYPAAGGPNQVVSA